MATFLLLNGSDIDAPVDEQERLMLELAAGRVSGTKLVDWLQEHLTTLRAVGSASGACRYPAAGGVGPRSQAQSSIAW
jgi:hypothetical protein